MKYTWYKLYRGCKCFHYCVTITPYFIRCKGCETSWIWIREGERN